jgi:DNA-binding transcriptional regulator LsrR (DeoR family)
MAKDIDPRVETWLIEGKTQKEMAALLGVSQPTVSRIVKRLRTSLNVPPQTQVSLSPTGSETQVLSAQPLGDAYGDTKDGTVRI